MLGLHTFINILIIIIYTAIEAVGKFRRYLFIRKHLNHAKAKRKLIDREKFIKLIHEFLIEQHAYFEAD